MVYLLQELKYDPSHYPWLGECYWRWSSTYTFCYPPHGHKYTDRQTQRTNDLVWDKLCRLFTERLRRGEVCVIGWRWDWTMKPVQKSSFYRTSACASEIFIWHFYLSVCLYTSLMCLIECTHRQTFNTICWFSYVHLRCKIPKDTPQRGVKYTRVINSVFFSSQM